jgi:hypothetical protein
LFAAPIPEPYWNAAGALYAYEVGRLSLLGIDVLGESQLVGYPSQVCVKFLVMIDISQYPSVTELKWTDGTPTARYWVLELMIKNFEMGIQFVDTSVSDRYIFYKI